jgi:putative DNA primase/helicase
VPDVLDRFAHVRPTGSGGWTAYCPVHECNGRRHRPSLSLGFGADGRLLVHCFAGCSTAAVLDAVGLAWGDLRCAAEPVPHIGWRVGPAELAEAGRYLRGCAARLAGGHAAAGFALGYMRERWGLSRDDALRLGLGFDPGSPAVARPPFAGSAFVGVARLLVPLIVAGRLVGFQGRAVGSGQPRWASPAGSGWGRVGTLALRTAGPVVVCEGPSDALAAVAAGYAATFVRGASLGASRDAAARTVAPLVNALHGRVVVVAGDGDEPGRRFTANVAAVLRAAGIDARAADPGDGLDLAALAHRRGPDALRTLVEGAA